MSGIGLSAPLRVWAIVGARAGDNHQVIALADALGLPFEVRELAYNGLYRLGPRLLGRSLASLTAASRDRILRDPPPDLTISAGARSVPVVRALRHRSSGRVRSVHIGFPRVSPGWFDLVATTPQYSIPDHPHLLRMAYALTTAATATPDPAELAELEALPGPRGLLCIGGANIYWRLDPQALFRTLETMVEEARGNGGSILVTTSARTPRRVHDAVASRLDAAPVPTILAQPGGRPGYPSLLAAADSIRVTADSVAMLSDAIWTEKPVALVPVAETILGKAVIAVMDRIRPGRALYPQDLRCFWRALAGLGTGEQPSVPRAHPNEELRRLLDRVEPILETLRSSD